MKTKHKPPLLFTAFTGGLVSLALELAAARLLAPAFGTTELVWTAIIGLILLYLSVGYVLGGRWADRAPYPRVLYTLLVGAGAGIAVIPLLARPMLHVAARGMLAWNVGLIAGPFLFVLVLFAVPVTLLACVSPFVIRLSLRDVAGSGATAGQIYAVSTLGSFIGTFLPNLVLIPNLGTRRTFLLLALVTLALGLWGLWHAGRRRFWWLLPLLPLVGALFLWQPSPIKPVSGGELLYEEESVYNFIQVVERPTGRRHLLLNEGQGIHSIYTPPGLYGEEGLGLLTGGPWDYYLVAPYFNPPPHPPQAVDNLLVIGLAAGTTPTQFTEVYGPLPIDGVEIDPAIVEAGRRFFAMTLPNLRVHVADGRYFLSQAEQSYSLIAVDAYRLPYIPWHLTTVEFFAQVRAHLRPDGVVAINVGHTPTDWRLVDALAATMGQLFPSVHVIPVEGSFNAIVVATVQPTAIDNLAANLPLLEDPRLRTVARRALAQARPPDPSPLTFTDDRAPLEQITHELALRYVLRLER